MLVRQPKHIALAYVRTYAPDLLDIINYDINIYPNPHIL